MKVQIRNGGVKVDATLRRHVERRVGLTLGRFGDRIAAVLVRFSPAGNDSCCQIDVSLRPSKITLEDTDQDCFTAVNHAADRVSRSVARFLERERDWHERAGFPPELGGLPKP